MRIDGPRCEKTCLWGLRTTKGQTFICFLESTVSKLATNEISFFKLVSVAEESGLSLPLSETLMTGFVTLRPK